MRLLLKYFRHFSLLIFLFSTSTYVFSQPICHTHKNVALRIGHTWKLDFFYLVRMYFSAWELGFKIDWIDLSKPTNWSEQLPQLDGVLVPGGADIDPQYTADIFSKVAHGAEKNFLKNKIFFRPTLEGKKRDKNEYEFYKNYFSNEQVSDLPVMAICRGMQMMALSLGVPLIQDVEAEFGINNPKYTFDKIKIIDQKSIVSNFFPEGKFQGFKLHHQNPNYLYYQTQEHLKNYLKVTAISKNKLIEVIEVLHRPAIGVQFHPEKSISKVKEPFFNWFLQKACERSKRILP